jgi:predicted permease
VRLVAVWTDLPASNLSRYKASGPEYLELERLFTTFESVGGIQDRSGTLTGDGEPQHVQLSYVTWNLFDVLNAAPLRGRVFEAPDQVIGVPVAAVISEALWRSRYGADPALIGRTITLDGADVSVVGVMPASFLLPAGDTSKAMARSDVWVPFTDDFAARRPNTYYVRTIGRLGEGVTLAQAQEEAVGVAQRLREMNTIWATENLELDLQPLKSDSVSGYRSSLLALLGAVGVVLLLACGNIANLILARASDRRREFAMRAALGASIGRLVQLLICESVLLFLLSGSVGAALASYGVDLLWSIRPVGLDSFDTIPASATVFLLSFAICFACGVICGLLPLLESRRVDVTGVLRGGERLVGLHAGSRARHALLVTEVAGGLVLLIVSALFINSLARLRHADPGFRPGQVLTFQVNMPRSRYPTDASRIAVVSELHRSLSELPSVAGLGAVDVLPLSSGNSSSSYATRENPDLDGNPPNADRREVLPGYFEAIGATLIEGRFFDERDHAQSERVVIVDELLVKRAWGDASGLGREIYLPYFIENGPVRHWARIVGVVKHLKHANLREDGREQMYLPYAHEPWPTMSFVLRTASAGGDAHEVIEAARARVSDIDPLMPVANVHAMDEYVAQSLTSPRFTTLLLTIFSGIALLLASIGLFGVLAYHVRQRTREFGIRLALGASPRRLWRQVVVRGLGLTGLGVAIGAPIAAGLTRLVSGLLYEVSPADPMTFGAIIALFLSVAFVACLLPARRAMRVDPMVALRSE